MNPKELAKAELYEAVDLAIQAAHEDYAAGLFAPRHYLDLEAHIIERIPRCYPLDILGNPACIPMGDEFICGVWTDDPNDEKSNAEWLEALVPMDDIYPIIEESAELFFKND